MREKKTYWLILLALVIAAFHQGLFIKWTNDDAYISYRYAENLRAGKGLVFNPGKKVEGYSNFLWVIILAFFNLLGISPLLASKILTFSLSWLLIILIFKTAQALGLDKLFACLCALTFSFSSSLAYFAMSGLETIFYALLLLLGVLLNEKYEKETSKKSLFLLYGALLGAALTRPEGLLFFLISSGYHILKKAISKRGIQLKNILQIQSLFLFMYAFLILLRYWYYGSLFPNTFYAKPQGTFVEQGFSAFFSNFINALFSGSFLLIPVLFLFTKRRYLTKYLYPLLFCLGQMVFMSYAGDWMAFGRFFMPVLPIVVVLTFVLLGLIGTNLEKSKSKLALKFLSIGLLVIFAGLNVFQTGKALLNQDAYPYLVMNSSLLVQTGKWLGQNFPPETVLSLRRQGAVPYHSGMNSIDMLGLTEMEIARTLYNEKDTLKANKINAEYILKQRPDVLILFSSVSYYDGWMFDKSNPEDRFFHLGYLLYQGAVQTGYQVLNSMPFGKDEKMHILVASGKEFPNLRTSSERLAEKLSLPRD
jgi:arabinofuranosyltransferase